MGALEHYAEILGAMPRAKRDQVVGKALKAIKGKAWIPNPGPQTDAYFSEADELLYGGEAGGGKTDLLVGLSLTAHKRSLLLRRTNAEADKLIDRYVEILGSRAGWNGQENVWRMGSGRVIDIGGCQHEDDKQKRKGIPHDLKAFDELVDFTQSQYEFIIGWNRSTDPKQRSRVVATTNPPTRPEGMWVVKRWAPWLDPKHPGPAKPGELRWFTTVDGVDTEVEGPGPHMVDGKPVMAKSRTFIRARLADNPDLARTDYDSRLAALPKELREAYREGKFDASLRDAPFQTIPTDWVRAAMARWTPRPPDGVPMCAMGVDASGGGEDPMMIAIRHDGWYAPLIEVPGKSIPIERAGKFGAGLVISYRRDRAGVVVDMGGGYGGSIYEQLKENEIDVVSYKGAEAATGRTEDKQLAFKNRRTQAYWRFREALDPSQPGGSRIMLPDDQALLAELCAPTFEAPGKLLAVEPKEDVCDRLGRSTDRADAVVMAWSYGPTLETAALDWATQREQRRPLHRRPEVLKGRHYVRR